MSRFGLVGPSYASQSPNADIQSCINWYPELDGSSSGNAPIVLYPTHGLKVFALFANGPHRGSITINGRTFVVAGTDFAEATSNGAITYWGTVVNDSKLASMAASPQQLLIASGGTAYIFDLNANTLTAIPGATFSGLVAQVGICASFFLVSIQNSKEFYVSGALNANDWVSNGPAIIDTLPDNLVSMTVVHREVFFQSSTKSCWYQAVSDIFPFAFIIGSDMDVGSAAEFGTVLLNNTSFWLGADERGQGVVYTARGYTQMRISNHALEYAIQGYTKISDAVGFTMQDQGHTFYFLYFPTPSVTWVYDTTTNMWHQRAYNIASQGVFQAARYQNHTFNFGKHLVGDWASGKLYQASIPVKNGTNWDFCTDDGNYIRRVRRAPHISEEQHQQIFTELQVYLETGLGPIPPLGPQQSETIILRDVNQQLWQIAVNDVGVLQSVKVPQGIEQTIFLNDIGNTQSYQITVTTLGLLVSTNIAYNALYPTFIGLISLSGLFVYNIRVTAFAGVIQTLFQGNFMPPRDPQVMLRWSKDGGHTWSDTHIRDCGKAGEFKKRVRWLRMGRARDLVIELSCSDPVPWRIVDAYIKIGNEAAA